MNFDLFFQTASGNTFWPKSRKENNKWEFRAIFKNSVVLFTPLISYLGLGRKSGPHLLYAYVAWRRRRQNSKGPPECVMEQRKLWDKLGGHSKQRSKLQLWWWDLACSLQNFNFFLLLLALLLLFLVVRGPRERTENGWACYCLSQLPVKLKVVSTCWPFSKKRKRTVATDAPICFQCATEAML